MTARKYKGCMPGITYQFFCGCTKTSYFTVNFIVHFLKFVLQTKSFYDF